MTYELHYWPGIQGAGRVRAPGAGGGRAPTMSTWRAARPTRAAAQATLARLAGEAVAGSPSPRRSWWRTTWSSPRPPTSCCYLGQTPRPRARGRGRPAVGQPACSSPSPTWWTRRTTPTTRSGLAPLLRGPEAEAAKHAKAFREERMPKYLGYFERILSAQRRRRRGPGRRGALTYADLSLFQVVRGLQYAFPEGDGGPRPGAFALVLGARRPGRAAAATSRPISLRPGASPSTSRASSGTIRSWTPRRPPDRSCRIAGSRAVTCRPRLRRPNSRGWRPGVHGRIRGRGCRAPARR